MQTVLYPFPRASFNAYLKSLPLDKIIQLHICQPSIPAEGIATDAHDAPNNQMFDEVISLTKKYKNIKYLTIEYYKDKNKLIESITTLKKLLKNESLR